MTKSRTWKAVLLTLCLTSLTLAESDTFFKVLIREIDNPAGTLLNGNPCSEFAYLGIGCNNYLKAAVSASGANVSYTNDSSAPINSHGETRVSNLNLVVSDDDDVSTLNALTGFHLHVFLAADPDFKNVIDQYVVHVNTTESHGVYTYTSSRPGTLSTTISIAWATNLAAPSTSTTSEPTTSETTLPFTGSTPKNPVDCDEVINKTSGNQIIYPDGSSPVSVYCDQSSNGAYTVIQSRGVKDDTPFNVSFANYTDQFGQPGNGYNYWFGLENMNKLTNDKNYSLQIDLCCGTNLTKKYLYHSFKIGNAESQYKLTATADIVKVGLAYESHVTDLGAVFSVPEGPYNYTLPKGKPECDQFDYYDDQDNQSVGYGGWWYGSCGNNLNGFLYPSNLGSCTISNGKFAETKYLGVNMRTSSGPGVEGYDVDLVSYDRVRMAIFSFDSARVDFNDDSFCRQ
uniref:Fibrinogen C-terminal domain-containing protein n=1 Tax=Caenorhabditis japonica TaxID=281687 RepID=A0A8R1I0A2_CAEJA